MGESCTPFTLGINGETYEGALAEIIVSGMNRVKEYVISAFRDIVSNPDPEFSRKFLTDYFGLCKFISKTVFNKEKEIFDILIESLESEDPMAFLNGQEDDKLKALARQIRGKQEVDDILDLLMNGD